MPEWFLETERMTLRPIDPGDWPEFERVLTLSEADMRPVTRTRPEGFTLEHFFASQLASTAQGMVEGLTYRLAAFLKGGPMVGFFNLNAILRGAHQQADIGYLVRSDQVGQGFAKEGVRAIVAQAFRPAPEGLGLHRIQATIKVGNVASERVAEAAGFRREGLLRGYLSVNGRYADHHLYALLSEDWEALRGDAPKSL